MNPAPRVQVCNPLLRTPLALTVEGSCLLINKASRASELARYWMAREVAEIRCTPDRLTVRCAFPTARFTPAIGAACSRVRLWNVDSRQVRPRRDFAENIFFGEGDRNHAAFDLPGGEAVLSLQP